MTTMGTDLNTYIAKRHANAVIKFNDELAAFAKETGEDAAVLYEDANTSFTLTDVRLDNGDLVYRYDGRDERETIVHYDADEKEYFEDDIDGVMEWIRFWRSCLRRARKYWSMDPDRLDQIQDGTIEDQDDTLS